MADNFYIHPLADVQTNQIGNGTRIWQYAVILKEARIGQNCNICAHTLIESGVIVGDNCTLKSGVFLWEGTIIEDSVFIGPNATFTNDRKPVSGNRNFVCEGITIKKGASIGASATLLPGITVGVNAMIGAGAVVTKDVPDNATVIGNPARLISDGL